MPSRSIRILAAALLALVAACGTTADPPDTAAGTTVATTATTTTPPPAPGAFPPVEPGDVASWEPEILARFDHDPEAFTQGLIVVDGTIYEGTGLYGQSTIREVDRTTGEVRRQAPLDAELFGEGIELVGDRLLQLTWQEETLVVWDRATFEEVDRITYPGEGWGLCLLDDVLAMSNGSADLTFRNPESFDPVRTVTVTRHDEPVIMLNELECVDGWVFANVWMTNEIVVIDPTDGRVVAQIDASALDDELASVTGRDVLNGIAYDEDTDTFLLTGKLWPTMFEVRFVATDA